MRGVSIIKYDQRSPVLGGGEMRMLGIGGVSYGTLLFLALIQRSAWNKNSANFEQTEF